MTQMVKWFGLIFGLALMLAMSNMTLQYLIVDEMAAQRNTSVLEAFIALFFADGEYAPLIIR